MSLKIDVTVTLTLDEAHALRAHLLPMHPQPEVERAKAKLEVAIDRTTLAMGVTG